ncbi:hypothetical protein A3Q56_06195 [Intoshia linei]|uniref:HTH CENPB-type domain-containing protein n=1 Tax=Intoshia linei TaxID=1819745 RepID=A0A177AXF1_9BILA|nr:hypothetical protein A3Q56_06195 [Intoshia linei]
MKKNITLNEKLNIIKMLNEGISVKQIAETLNKSINTIYSVKRCKPKIMNIYQDSNVPESMGSFKRMRLANCKEVENKLYGMFVKQRHNDVSISEETLIVEAKSIDNCSDTGSNVERNDCQFSRGWLNKFKRRNGIKSYKLCGDSEGANVEATRKFDRMPNL